jgi:thiamine biosynthesis lipoprotein
MDTLSRTIELVPGDGHWVGRFRAMGSPCEVLVETSSAAEAEHVTERVAACAWRIDEKFSRYRTDNIVHAINTADGASITVDEETAGLLDFAATLHQLSEGRFDITSGALRRAWTFDGGACIPSQAEIDALLPLVGWDKATWQRPVLTMLPGMQIDFGGIGKEYAVDQATLSVRSVGTSALINFGGDLAVSIPRRDGGSWRVGIEAAGAVPRTASRLIHLREGALASSGDTYRYLLNDGRRYTHILDPRTGRPVENAPRSVTVAAPTCTQAGMLATLAALQGTQAGRFLEAAGAQHWIQGS